MTDTTKPPNRPHAPRPRPFGRDESRRQDDQRRDDRRQDERRQDDRRGGDRPRGGAALTRGAEPAPPKDDARIAKVMARAGLCSRRDAEGWIAAGRVAVNGAVIDSPALNVKPGDRITVDGEPLPEREQTQLYLFHKPRGLVTTARDPEGRPTIFDNLPEGLPRVVSVGRLDINTEGLMLLTNDGGLARVLELPATGWLRRYRVRANGEIDQPRLDALKAGVTIDGVDYAGIEATLDRVQGANAWLTMGLREGKNREIKRVLESLGLAVTRLIRISFGPFQLGELVEGAVEVVPTRVLREQLGPGLAAQAGVDLDARDGSAERRGARGEDGIAPPRPSRSAPAAPRPHVGALRALREEEAGEGRKRTLRGATADRRGRTVAVERVVPVAEGSPRGDSRNARRFAAEKGDYVAGRQKTRAEADGGRPARGGFAGRVEKGGFAGRADKNGFAPRSERTGFAERLGKAGFAGRGEKGGSVERSEKSGFAGRADRGERTAFAAKVRRGEFGEDAAERPRGPRAGRFDPKTRGDRAEGFGAARPERGGFGDGTRGERPARGERSGFGERPGGARAGKPNARPGGFGSERPVTGRNKKEGGRPAGGKPRGAPPGGGRPSNRPPRGRP